MEPIAQFQVLGISLVLGLLVGLQREVSHSRPAGFRTFPLITIFGTLCALLGLQHGAWIPALGFVAILILSILGNVMTLRAGGSDPGVTTEVAVLLMYTVGAYLVVGSRPVAIVTGGVAAILLHLKPELHRLASRLDREDLKAIMQFVLVAFVVLPILPHRTFGPLNVFNPFVAWLMVVLIVGISLAGYLVYRFLGARAGILTGGLVGGLISSTATTVSYARMAGRSAQVPRAVAVVIVLASSVLYARVLILLGVISPGFLATAAPPVILMGLFPALMAFWMWRQVNEAPENLPVHRNPTELKTALTFAVIYIAVLIVIGAAREYWGSRELFLIGAISGLVDLDAITVSTAQLVDGGKLDPGLGSKMVVAALMVNTLLKVAVASALGGRQLFAKIVLPLGISVLAGLAILFFA